MHTSAFGVYHISKRVIKYKNEAVGAAAGGVVGGSVAAAFKPINGVVKGKKSKQIMNAANSIMDGGSNGADSTKKLAGSGKLVNKLPKGGPKVIAAGAAGGAAAGGIAAHKLSQRSKA